MPVSVFVVLEALVCLALFDLCSCIFCFNKLCGLYMGWSTPKVLPSYLFIFACSKKSIWFKKM